MVRGFSLPSAKGYGVRVHRIGCANRPFYLIGAVARRVPLGRSADRRPDEIIGSVDPLPNEHNEIIIGCDLTRLNYYIGKGASPRGKLAEYLSLVGFWPFTPKVMINSWRKRQGKDVRGGIQQTPKPS